MLEESMQSKQAPDGQARQGREPQVQEPKGPRPEAQTVQESESKSRQPRPGWRAVWQTITLKDLVFLAVLSVVLTLAGMLTMPIVMALPVFGLRNAAAAVLYGLFLSIGLLKVRKPGALLLLAFFNGAVLLFMTR